jgi:Flp pilus assembly secretin CpaC
VIIVTPRLVAATADPSGGARSPLASTPEPSQAELFLQGRTVGKPAAAKPGGR